MIREKTPIEPSQSPFSNNMNTGSDSLKIKDPVVKLIIPKSNTEFKLKEINERIEKLDPKKKEITPSFAVKEIEVDTSSIKLFDEDTISFLVKHDIIKNNFAENFFVNIPDYKPVFKLTDSLNVITDEIRLEKTENTTQIRTTYKGAIYNEGKNNYNEQFSSNWIPAFLVFVLLILAWIKVFYNKVLRLTLRSTFNSLISNRLFREKNTLTIWGGLFLNFLCYLSGAFFLYLLFTYFGYRINNATSLNTFFYILLVLIFIYLFKYSIVKLIGFIFVENTGFSEYLHNVFLFNKSIGIYILPIIVAVPFIPEPGKEILLKAGIGILISFYFFRIYRGLKIGIKINVSILYLILYLCTLEFFPLLILYKLFVEYTS
ncbi:DUF4271 domain-containing protein [Bacteroidota bacterium]